MTSSFVRLGASASAVAMLFVAGAAFAQATKSPTPAPAPAPPGAPAQPTGPVKLDLVAMQSPWTKLCGKDASNNGREVCYTTRDFGQSGGQGPTLAMAVYQMAGEDKRNVRFLLPLGLLLRPGFRMTLEKGEPIDGKFALCFPTGCFAEAEINGATLGVLKKSPTAAIAVRNQANVEVTFNIPMKDFAAAFDGPPIDPKVLEQQNQELQHQLEEKARLQREQLEKSQSSAQPAPSPSPSTTPTPPK
jgi:invasion protein IalB